MASSKHDSGSKAEQPDKLSALYRSLGRESSPEHLDDIVLKRAQDQLEMKERPQNKSLRTLLSWERVISVAAVMVLSIYIALDNPVENRVDTEVLMDDAVLSRSAPAEELTEPGLTEKVYEAKDAIPTTPEPAIQVQTVPNAPLLEKRENVSPRIFIDAATEVEGDDFFDTKSAEPKPSADLQREERSKQKVPGNLRIQTAPMELESPKQEAALFSPSQVTSNFAAGPQLDAVLEQDAEETAAETEIAEKTTTDLQKRLDEIERIYINGDVEIAKLAYAQLRIDYKDAQLPVDLETYLKGTN